MREKILNALKTKYPGVDAKTLERVADKLSKTVTTEDAVQTAVDGVTVQQLMESYGDARANEAQASAVHFIYLQSDHQMRIQNLLVNVCLPVHAYQYHA